jgi:hypothetical protein
MVRLVGIEPTAPWFVAKYSNPLSYRRILLFDYRILEFRILELFYNYTVFKEGFNCYFFRRNGMYPFNKSIS